MKEAGFPAFQLSMAVVVACFMVGMATTIISSARVGDCRPRDKTQGKDNSDQFFHSSSPSEKRASIGALVCYEISDICSIFERCLFPISLYGFPHPHPVLLLQASLMCQ